MYREYFGFKENPFGLTPDTRFVFLSNNHREGFAHLWYGLHQGGGFIVLTGEIGTGKTTLLRTLLARLDSGRWRSALVFNPALSPNGLFREILREFGLPSEGRDSGRLMQILNDYLLRENAAGRSVLLVLDEAQNLRPDVLEKIRLLSNLETESRKLLHIVLAGQPELGRLLNRPELRQLRQRVSVHYHLRSMDAADTMHYVAHRLKRAGGTENAIFNRSAMHKIYRFTGGIPRLINILCDRCLLLAFVSNRKNVKPGMVRKAVTELQTSRRRYSGLLKNPVLQAFFLGSLLLLLGYWSLSHFLFAAQNRPAVSLENAAGITYAAYLDSPGQKEGLGDKAEDPGVVAAFNALADAWQVPVLESGERAPELGDLWTAAKIRGLEVSGVRGSLEELLRLDYPVLVRVQGIDGTKVVTVLEKRRDKFRVVPAVDGRSWLSLAELAGLWSGEAFLFWRNDLNIPRVLLPGTRDRNVRSLQELLSAVGGHRIRIDGVYGRETIGALKKFQLQQGLEPDEHLGMATLLRLHQEAEQSRVPKLQKDRT